MWEIPKKKKILQPITGYLHIYERFHYKFSFKIRRFPKTMHVYGQFKQNQLFQHGIFVHEKIIDDLHVYGKFQ